jgi:hypothetical protein
MKKNALLIVIVFIGLLLRTVLLTTRPLGFTWDEAALGYNAYSVLKTGRDEHGVKLPIIFQSFGDYKPGLYVYFAIPPIKLFGLTEFATRLPSAIFGTLLIISVYLLAKQLLPTIKFAPEISALLLAINPWAINFSRGAWEANLSLLVTTLGALLYLKKNYLFSALFFGLSLWSYQGAKLFTPLLVSALLISFRPHVSRLVGAFCTFVFLLFVLPLILGFSTQSGRLQVFSVFSYTRKVSVVSEIARQDNLSVESKNFQLFHSETFDQLRGVIERYLNHFSPRFLFIDGNWSDLRQSTPYYGYFHYPEIISLLLGLALLITSRHPALKLLALWAIFAPLPSALSRDIVSGVRSLPLVIPLTLISAVGFSWLVSRPYKYFFVPILFVFTLYFLDLYFIHAPFYSAKYWLYPYKQALALVKNNIASYKKVIFTDTLGQPYIFVLFYYQIDPRDFQHQAHYTANQSGDVGSIKRFDKFYFEKVDWPAERGDTSTIFVGNQYELPDQDMNPINLVRLGEIYYPDGSHALRLIGLK